MSKACINNIHACWKQILKKFILKVNPEQDNLSWLVRSTVAYCSKKFVLLWRCFEKYDVLPAEIAIERGNTKEQGFEQNSIYLLSCSKNNAQWKLLETPNAEA